VTVGHPQRVYPLQHTELEVRKETIKGRIELKLETVHGESAKNMRATPCACDTTCITLSTDSSVEPALYQVRGRIAMPRNDAYLRKDVSTSPFRHLSTQG
jgi:hypothetical protein